MKKHLATILFACLLLAIANGTHAGEPATPVPKIRIEVCIGKSIIVLTVNQDIAGNQLRSARDVGDPVICKYDNCNKQVDAEELLSNINLRRPSGIVTFLPAYVQRSLQAGFTNRIRPPNVISR